MTPRSNARLAALLLALGMAAAPACADPPLSAIDWLSDSIALPAGLPLAQPEAARHHRSGDVADSALHEEVTVAPLDAPIADALGLYPASRAGLPANLWDRDSVQAIEAAHPATMTRALPALRELFRAMLEAQTVPPAGTAEDDALFLTRVDALLAMGALRPAAKLLAQVNRDAPRHFRRWFDIALLNGTENAACDRMRAAQGITPTYPARIFCLARGGDWPAAALTLETARTLSVVDATEEALLVRFLDDHGEADLALPPPRQPTPLEFAIYEAIGEPMRAASLPIAFSHADLRPNTGWKARLEAAERLAVAGAIAPDRLWRIYGEREPAASGALWDRVAAVQALDEALAAEDESAISVALPPSWQALRAVGLDYALARRYGARLARMQLTGDAAGIALRAGLLSDEGRRQAPEPDPDATDQERFLLALTRGRVDQAAPPRGDETAAAIRDGFQADAPLRIAEILNDDRPGAALLAAIALMHDGEAGNLDSLVDGLAALRAAGQTDAAIAAALQLMILDRRG